MRCAWDGTNRILVQNPVETWKQFRAVPFEKYRNKVKALNGVWGFRNLGFRAFWTARLTSHTAGANSMLARCFWIAREPNIPLK